MALDFKALITEDLFLPGLLQQVFNKYKRLNGSGLSTVKRAQLFIELSALLGEELLESALRLLDEWDIIIYYTPNRLRRITELSSKRNSAHVLRILPSVNYCKCSYFQRCVLQLPGEDLESRNTVSFTCEHILADRLHQLLKQNPHEQILTLEQFQYFNEDFYDD